MRQESHTFLPGYRLLQSPVLGSRARSYMRDLDIWFLGLGLGLRISGLGTGFRGQ